MHEQDDPEDAFKQLMDWTPEQWEEAERERREKHLSRTEEEKEHDLGQRADAIWELMCQVEECYLIGVEERIRDLDYDWYSRSNDEKLDLFDRASRHLARHMDGSLADYLKEKVRERFGQSHLGEE